MSQYLRRNDSASLNQEPTGSRWRELARKARLRVAYTVPLMTALSRLRRQLSQQEHIIKNNLLHGYYPAQETSFPGCVFGSNRY